MTPQPYRLVDGQPAGNLELWDGAGWVSMHSRRNPAREAEQMLDAVDAGNCSTLCVVGLGLGHLLDALKRRGWQGRVVDFEPLPAIDGPVPSGGDRQAWLDEGRLTTVTGPDYDGLDELVPKLSPDREQPVVVVNPVLARCYPSLTAAAVERAG